MTHIVLDLEMTYITDKSDHAEIIEIGAVKLDNEYNQISLYQTYVNPDNIANIGHRCTELTGITPDMVAFAPKIDVALYSFMSWINSEEIVIYSWGKSDKQQLYSECKRRFSSNSIEGYIKAWLDIQSMFKQSLKLASKTSLKQAINIAGMCFDGREHSAISDAINAARLLSIIDNKIIKQYMR